MKKNLLFIIALFWATLTYAQLIRQPISNFTPREYGQNIPAYTYSIAECENGLIYVGTTYGVLQFDGVSWRFINVKLGAAVTSIAVHNGRVYLGCHGDFGYLVTTEHGKFEFKSLASEIPNDDLNFSAVWKTLVLNDTIVFQAEESLFLYHNNSLTVVKPNHSFHQAFLLNNTLFVRERGSGLWRFDGSKFNLVSGGEQFAEYGVFAVLPYQNNSELIVTREKGLWEKDANMYKRVKLEPSLEKLLSSAELIGGVRLDDENFALYSLKGGIFILSPTLQLIANYSINSGMLTSEIRDLIQDKNGNIWSATQKGVSRLQYTSAFSVFNQTSGLFGSVQSISKTDNSLLVGTNEGLFVNVTQGLKVFDEVKEVTGSVWAMETTKNGIWIATDNGLWFYNGSSFSRIHNNKTSALKYIPEKKWIVAAGIDGFFIVDEITKNVLLELSSLKADSYGLAYEFVQETGCCQIWMGTKTTGVWQVTIDNNLKLTYDYYNFDDGLPLDWVCAYQAGENVVFATWKGMLRFITPQEMMLLIGDGTGEFENLRGYFDIVDFPLDSYDKTITAFNYNPTKSYIGLGYQVHAINMKDSTSSGYDFKALELGRLNVINTQNNELFIGGDNGLAIVQSIDNKERSYPVPNIAIRSISIGKDSVVWYGDVPLGDKTIIIPYHLNNIQVDLASNYFDNGITAQYAWKLNDSKSNYTRWSNQNIASLSNLREGDYELLLVAKNVHNELSNELSVKFRILAPWYRTWWAYVLYLIFSAIIVLAIIQFNIRRLKEQNRKLEEIVKERTSEVVKQKEHIQHILEDIQSSINYAQRIQQALLPSRELLKEYLPNHFIVFHPRDVVSGDFYWATKIDDWVIVTVADSTGHGVPGAFMSMLGISFLNEIVRKKEVTNTAIVLDQLRAAIIEALKQTGKQNEQKDGMDMSIIAVNQKTLKGIWAGANNPLYIIRNGIAPDDMAENESKKLKFYPFENNYLIEIKGDKMPVAIYTVMDSYTSHEVDLQKGDRLYLFTDGFSDQFGGPDYRKFLAKNFKMLISDTASLPIDKQGDEINATFMAWKGIGDKGNEQIDDVTVLGIEI